MAGRSCCGDRIHRQVDVQVTAPIGGHPLELCASRPSCRARPAEVEHDLSGQSARRFAQRFIRRGAQIGEQVQRLAESVRNASSSAASSKAPSSGETAANCSCRRFRSVREMVRAPRCGRLTGELPAPGGGPLLPPVNHRPRRGSRDRPAQVRKHPGTARRTMSSAVRPADSDRRIRPESDTNAASSPRCQSSTEHPRAVASEAPTRTMSMAPRTDDPTRTSG